MRIILIIICCFLSNWTLASAQDIPSVETLKLADAYRLQLDQDPAFQMNWMIDQENYLRILVENKFEKIWTEDKKEALPNYYIKELAIPLPQRESSKALKELEVRVDSIFNSMTLNWSDQHFDQLIDQFSSEKSPRWVNSLEETREFQRVLERLEEGEIAQPFLSPKGLHIVQLLTKGKKQMQADHSLFLSKDDIYKNLDIHLNSIGQHELLHRGGTSQHLLETPHRRYTQHDFDLFAKEQTGKGMDALWQYFQEHVILEEMKASVLDNVEVRASLDSIYRIDLIEQAFELRVLEQNPLTDEVLSDYYKSHREDYYWDKPKFEGLLVFCKSRKVRNALHKELSAAPLSEWKKVVDRFNVNEILVQYEMGQFEEGENGTIDAYIFKRGKKKNFKRKGYTKTRTYGEVILGPSSYLEIKSQVEKDYIRVLEQIWVNNLQTDFKSGKLSVNFLKSVNNQASN